MSHCRCWRAMRIWLGTDVAGLVAAGVCAGRATSAQRVASYATRRGCNWGTRAVHFPCQRRLESAIATPTAGARMPTRRAKVERGGNARTISQNDRWLLYFISTPLRSPVGLQFLLLHVALHAKQAGLSPLRMVVTVGALGRPLCLTLARARAAGMAPCRRLQHGASSPGGAAVG